MVTIKELRTKLEQYETLGRGEDRIASISYNGEGLINMTVRPNVPAEFIEISFTVYPNSEEQEDFGL